MSNFDSLIIPDNGNYRSTTEESATMNVQGKVTGVYRLNNTLMGNPMYLIELDGIGKFKTPANAGWIYAYTWDNLVGKTVYVEAHKPRTNWIMHELRVAA